MTKAPCPNSKPAAVSSSEMRHPTVSEWKGALESISLSCRVPIPKLIELFHAGVVPEDLMPALSHATSVAAHPAEARHVFYNEICRHAETFANHAALKRHKQLARTFGISAYHSKILVGIQQLLAPFGNPMIFEVKQLIDVPEGSWASFKLDMAAAMGAMPGLLDLGPPACDASLDDLLSDLPFDYRLLRNTCADPVKGHRFDDVEPGWCKTAATIQTFRDLAVVGMVVLATRGKKSERISSFLRALRRMDILAAIYHDAILGDEAPLSSLCRIYIAQPVHGGRVDNDTTRSDTVAGLKREIAVIRDFIDGRALEPIREELDLIVPYEIQLGDSAKILSDLRTKAQVEGLKNRKSVTNSQNDTLNKRYRSMRARSFVMRLIGDAIRSRVLEVLETEHIVDCTVVVPTLDDQGIPTAGRQVEIFRIWPADLAMVQFGKKPRPLASNSSITERYIVEHVATEPFGQHPENETWAITIAKNRVHGKVASASAEVQAARHETMIRFNLLGGRPSHHGLCVFERWKSQLAIAAAARGTTFVQVEEIEAAVRLAYLVCQISEQSRARFESISQLRPKEFRRDDKGACTPRHSQDVLPKWTRGGNPNSIQPIEINISEACLDEMVSICRLHMRAAGLDVFPTMKPLKAYEWKVSPDQFALSWSGRVIDAVTMSHCLDLLQAGWKRLSIHDLRYCLSEEGALDGESEVITQISLGHSREKDTKDYRYTSVAGSQR